MIDMELEDNLKLKVATRLMDKSAATWWDNFKLCTSIPITWELFVREFKDQTTLVFIEIRNDKSFLDLDNLGSP